MYLPSLPRLPPLPSSIGAGKPPTWNLSALEHRACPVCGLDNPIVLCLRPDGLGAARCAGCAMAYLPDVPSDEEISRYYQSYGDTKGYARAPASRSRFSRAIDAFRDFNVRVLDQTGGLRGQRVLELGASYGGFLERARFRGAEVYGVDVDETARAHLARVGIECGPSMPSGRRFDAICAFQVMEHLGRPGELVERMSASLVTDGRLLISVPNGGEIDGIGSTWVGFRVDLEHLNYFSAVSLGNLLARHGLYVEQHWLSSQPAIGRPAPTPSSHGITARALALGTSAVSRLFEATRMAREGTFVLTLLARKVA